MKLRSVLREFWHNTATGSNRALLFTITLTMICGGISAADTITLATLEKAATTFHESGSATYIISAAGGVSGTVCQQLASIDGIEASGAMRTADSRLEVMALPGASIPIIETTYGFSAVLAPSAHVTDSGLLLSPQVAATLGADTGVELTLIDGMTTEVAGIFSYLNDGRLQALQYVALAAIPADDVFDQCWATVWPANGDNKNLLNISLTADATAASVSIGQLNTSNGASFDGPTLFRNRLTASAPIFAAAFASLIGTFLGSLFTRERHLFRYFKDR